MSAGGMGGQAQPMGGGKGGMGMTQGPAAGGKGGMDQNLRGPAGNAQNNPGGPRPFGPGPFNTLDRRSQMNVFPGLQTSQQPQSLPKPAFMPDQGLTMGSIGPQQTIGKPQPQIASFNPSMTFAPPSPRKPVPMSGLLSNLYGNFGG